MSQVERKFQEFFANFSRLPLGARKAPGRQPVRPAKTAVFSSGLKLCGVSNTDGLPVLWAAFHNGGNPGFNAFAGEKRGLFQALDGQRLRRRDIIPLKGKAGSAGRSAVGRKLNPSSRLDRRLDALPSRLCNPVEYLLLACAHQLAPRTQWICCDSYFAPQQ
jgi:hypothetical protein